MIPVPHTFAEFLMLALLVSGALLVLGAVVGPIATTLATRRVRLRRRLENRLETFYEEYDRSQSDAVARVSAG
jgi:uncharacterized membrane-anchored protein YhcB (DUF1043 family)